MRKGAGKVGGLAGVNPREVPLPHGTQVTTTVEMPLPGSERVIPQGVVGRVVGILADGRVRVSVIGRGEVVYRRADIIPRKEGELRFAVRRAWAEQCLLPCAVLEATVGSRAWGLADDASDTDRRGVFLLPFTWSTGLVAAPDVLVSADGSATHWEVQKAIVQALRADPNTLETLFVPEIRVLDPMGARILEEREAFASQEIYGSFGRYALAQAKKLRQSHRLASIVRSSWSGWAKRSWIWTRFPFGSRMPRWGRARMRCIGPSSTSSSSIDRCMIRACSARIPSMPWWSSRGVGDRSSIFRESSARRMRTIC